MGKKGTNGVVDGTYFSFDFSILRGCVRTRKSKRHSSLFTKFIQYSVIIFFVIVTLKIFNFFFKLF